MTELSARESFISNHYQSPDVSIRQVMDDYIFEPSDSLRALLVEMGGVEYGKGGPFIAQKHAFHFKNEWGFNESDAHELNERIGRSLNEVVSNIQSLVKGELSRMSIPIPFADRLPSIPTPCGDIKVPDSLGIPKSLIDVVLVRLHSPIQDYLLGKFLNNIPGSYGRCGGMAFAGLDFYHAKWPVDARFGDSQPSSGPLRDYIWRRLLDSLELNLTEFIWVKVKYLMLPDLSRIATDVTKAAIGAFGGRVASIISNYLFSKANIFNFSFNSNEYSLNSLNQICHKLKHEQPAWPMGLVFDSYNVFDDHQVLVIGYQKFEGGGLLRVWDNNDGAESRLIRLDFTKSRFSISYGNETKRTVVGIICENYKKQMPPQTLRLT